MSGHVWLVGAGPGDPDLITVKGMKALQLADCVVYDRLANPQLLCHAPQAEHIYVGKTPYGPTTPQATIGDILLEQARAGKRVVRLKGGDPFVFGRGGEEVALLSRNAIPVTIVPGISSALAVPALAGIPVTHRHTATSFTVITGHLAPDNKEGYDWPALPKTDTLVILMGVKQLPRIAAQLMALGRAANTPAAIIENGTLPQSRTFVASLDRIAAVAKDNSVKPPAIVVIGEVVALRDAAVLGG